MPEGVVGRRTERRELARGAVVRRRRAPASHSSQTTRRGSVTPPPLSRSSARGATNERRRARRPRRRRRLLVLVDRLVHARRRARRELLRAAAPSTRLPRARRLRAARPCRPRPASPWWRRGAAAVRAEAQYAQTAACDDAHETPAMYENGAPAVPPPRRIDAAVGEQQRLGEHCRLVADRRRVRRRRRAARPWQRRPGCGGWHICAGRRMCAGSPAGAAQPGPVRRGSSHPAARASQSRAAAQYDAKIMSPPATLSCSPRRLALATPRQLPAPPRSRRAARRAAHRGELAAPGAADGRGRSLRHFAGGVCELPTRVIEREEGACRRRACSSSTPAARSA